VDASTGRDLTGWLSRDPATRWCVTLTNPGGQAVAHACARHGPGPGPPDPASTAGWLRDLRMSRLETGTCTHQRQVRGYRPPASLRHLIIIRNPVCTAPGCRRPATTCDLDHVLPWDQHGRTCECNLHPLCRSHHRAKQVPGWHVEQTEPGTVAWTLPHGRTYTTRPPRYLA
jgi:hypothetical protein